ncbi:hypothetical protein ABFU84_08695 [Xanthomonas translucens pv. undulosa]|uniref:hypothetical protein n=1 Tax=Xanthomonas campestris pv. translucens TaxID=343 RepID=UPI003CFB15D1
MKVSLPGVRFSGTGSDKLLKAAGYDTRGKNLRKTMKKKRKAAHVAREGKKTGKMRGSLAR